MRIKLVVVSLATLVSLALLPQQSMADPPSLTPYPASLDLGAVNRYTTSSPPQAVSFNNETAGPLSVSSVSLAAAAEFRVQTDWCTGQSIASGGSCTVYVDVTPRQRGALADTLTLTDTAGTVDVPVSADARTGTITPGASPLTFDAAPWYFGRQYGSSNLYIADYGVQFGSATITGPDANLFSIDSDGCSNQQFAWGNSYCWFSVYFNPMAASGPANATLTFPSDSPSDPVAVPLEADALAGPVVSPSSTEIDFGAVEVGQSSAARTVTITNSGDYPLQIQQVLLTSGSSQAFPLANNTCNNRMIPPAGSCSLATRFSPTRIGRRDASLLVISNTSEFATISLSGTGVTTPDGAAVISGDPRVGKTLSCAVQNPNGAVSYSWVSGGTVVTGASKDQFELREADRAKLVRCRATITNELGSRTVDSEEVGPVAERDLAGIPGSELGRGTCRAITLPSLGRGITIRQSSPLTASSPLRIEAKRKITVAIGSAQRTGRRLTFDPRALAGVDSGVVEVRLGGASKGSTTLSDCQFTASLIGGKGHGARIEAASSRSLDKLRLQAQRLRFRPRAKIYGSVTVRGNGGDDQSFPIATKKTRSNGISVAVKGQTITIRNLPSGTGRVSVELDRSAVRGSRRSGLVVRGGLSYGGSAEARVRALWR